MSDNEMRKTEAVDVFLNAQRNAKYAESALKDAKLVLKDATDKVDTIRKVETLNLEERQDAKNVADTCEKARETWIIGAIDNIRKAQQAINAHVKAQQNAKNAEIIQKDAEERCDEYMKIIELLRGELEDANKITEVVRGEGDDASKIIQCLHDEIEQYKQEKREVEREANRFIMSDSKKCQELVERVEILQRFINCQTDLMLQQQKDIVLQQQKDIVCLKGQVKDLNEENMRMEISLARGGEPNVGIENRK